MRRRGGRDAASGEEESRGMAGNLERGAHVIILEGRLWFTVINDYVTVTVREVVI